MAWLYALLASSDLTRTRTSEQSITAKTPAKASASVRPRERRIDAERMVAAVIGRSGRFVENRTTGPWGPPAASGGAPPQWIAMDFDLSDDHELIRRTVRDFAENEVAPVAEELDKTKAFPYAIVRQLGD